MGRHHCADFGIGPGVRADVVRAVGKWEPGRRVVDDGMTAGDGRYVKDGRRLPRAGYHSAIPGRFLSWRFSRDIPITVDGGAGPGIDHTTEVAGLPISRIAIAGHG
jgi:hypothetical protein